MAEAIAFQILAATGITATQTAIAVATTVASLSLSVATSAIISALTPAPPSPKQSLLVNSRDAAAPHEFVYGEVRKGGPITYLETTRGGSVLYQIIPIAAHEIESVEAIYINDEVATLSPDGYDNGDRTGAGWVTSPRKWSEDDDEGKHEIRVFYHLGDQTTKFSTFANSSVESLDTVFFNTGSADEDSQNFGGVGQPTRESFIGNGIAYLFIRFSYAADVFRNGIPVITAKIKGKKVYNPGTGATEYSNNAALCIRDFLTSAYGLNDTQVNDTVFINAANICDEGVTLADGITTEKRYTINGVVRADQTYGDVLQQMTTSCAGTLFWGGGKFKLTVGDYNAPTKTFTLDDLRSDISLQTRTNLRDQFNRVQGTFVNQDNRYITEDYPPYPPAADYPTSAFLAQDNGVEQTLDFDLPFTTSSATAQRLAKMTLFRGRKQKVFSADFGLNAFDVEVGEVVALTIERYGWVEKEFEVEGWNLNISSEGGDLRVTLTLRETSAAAFDWNADESEIISNDSDLTAFLEPVTNLTATGSGEFLADGTFSNGILVSWTGSVGATGYRIEWTQNNAIDYTTNGGIVQEGDAVTTREQFIYKAYIELLFRQPDQNGFDFYNTGGGSGLDEGAVRAQLAASPERTNLTYAGIDVGEFVTQYTIRPVLDNTIYHTRVKATNRSISSAWRSVTHETEQDTLAPAAPTNLVGVGYFQSATLKWTAPTTNSDGSALDDLAGYNIYRSVVDDFSSSTLEGSVPGANFVDGGLEDNTVYYYWVTAFDSSGNESVASTSENITTNFLSAAQMVDNIREEIGAARIDVVSSLPSGSGYNVGDFVFLTSDKKLYEWDGSNWVATVGEIEANSVVAGMIAAGAVSADKMAVNDLAAITANLGEVTAGSLNTVSGGVGLQVNVSGKPNSVYAYQNNTSVYGLFARNIAVGGGTMEVSSNGGFTSTFLNSNTNSGAFGAYVAVNAQNTGSGGGHGQVGVSLAGGGYAFRSADGGFYDVSGDGYNPFTGRHDGMISKSALYTLGDIVIDARIISRNLSDSFTELSPSSEANQKGAVGVVAKVFPEWYTPASFIDSEASRLAQEGHIVTPDSPMAAPVTTYNVSDYEDDYDLITINSVGEGAVNVCGENGNISKGDLIVTSSMPGKGMKQADDIVRSYTVAKVREDVTFSDPTEVKLVACIYLCG